MSWLLALCLVAGEFHAEIPVHQFTLSWQHSIEKIDWEEDYVVAGDWLYLSSARIRGSGAGMEPPPGSFFYKGVWHYQPAPAMRWTQNLLLTRSEFARDYDICINGQCKPMSHWVPVSAGNTSAKPCKVQVN
jgi:hypothetical protein